MLRKIVLPLVYFTALAWVNAYICRDMFFTEHTGHMNSMHGVWIAMARLAPAGHWLKPAWWPFWYGGMPFEHTYSPLVPGLTSAVAKLAGWSPARAYYAVSGFMYCFGPLALFLMAWRTTRSPGYSFAAGLLYSLVAPTELLVPDTNLKLSHFWDARRLYLTVVWDETPHLFSLAFVLLLVVFLHLSFQKRKPAFYLLAGVFMAAAVLANAFGATMTGIVLLCLVFALEPRNLRSNLALALAIGAVAYLIISPVFPPSLVRTIQFNADRFEGGWTVASLTAFLGVALGWLVLWRYLHRWTADWPLRFFALFAYASSSIPLLAVYANRHFVPQPARYKQEMEIALSLLLVFALKPVLEKLNGKVKVTLALFLLSLAAEQVISHRRFAKQIIRPVNVTEGVEYRVAKWVEERFRDQRVMMPGSIGQWLNAFTEIQNFAGGSYPTAPNWTQQVAFYDVYAGQSGADSIRWLKAYGVQAVAVSGPKSREFWKPYANPQKFEGLLPVLWQENDVTIYRLPQRSPSLAHVMPASEIVRREPNLDPSPPQVEKYIAALDDPSLPPAPMRWGGWNAASIRTIVPKGQIVSVQVNYHPGWHARANSQPAETFQDGLGLLSIRPDCNGPCDIQLTYDGGREYTLCHAASALALLGVFTYAYRTRRRKPLNS